MDLGLIKDLRKYLKEIGILFAQNSVLYLWATAPKLLWAIEVMEAWGFTYKTNAVWDKQIMGMGYWFRGRHELVLVGTMGKFSPPEPSRRRSSIFHEKRMGHSVKPKSLQEHIEAAFPKARKIELFAREPRDGWMVWGDQVAESS